MVTPMLTALGESTRLHDIDLQSLRMYVADPPPPALRFQNLEFDSRTFSINFYPFTCLT